MTKIKKIEEEFNVDLLRTNLLDQTDYSDIAEDANSI